MDQKSLIESKGALQFEAQNGIKNVQRPTNPNVNVDFEGTDVKTGNRTWMDHKYIPNLKKLTEKGKSISGYKSHQEIAYNIGKKIPKQQQRFLGLPDGPKSEDDIIFLVNFGEIDNPLEKHQLLDLVIIGAEEVGSAKNIRFLNFE